MFSYMAAQLLSAKEVLPTHSYPSEGLLPALRRESGSPGDAAKAFKGVTMGTPDDVTDAIVAWENVGFDGINFICQFMEVLPQQYVLDSMRLFAEEVMPRFKTGDRLVAAPGVGSRRRPRRGGGGLMPLAGSLDIRPACSQGSPEVVLDEDADVAGRRRRHPAGPLRGARRRPGVPRAPCASNPNSSRRWCLSSSTWAKESLFGPFALAQVRLTARSGVRPRAYLVSARCDNPDAVRVVGPLVGFPGDARRDRAAAIPRPGGLHRVGPGRGA